MKKRKRTNANSYFKCSLLLNLHLIYNISVLIKNDYYFRTYLSHATTDVAMQSTFDHYLKRYISRYYQQLRKGMKI